MYMSLLDNQKKVRNLTRLSNGTSKYVCLLSLKFAANILMKGWKEVSLKLQSEISI
jgi:hypothetical protein